MPFGNRTAQSPCSQSKHGCFRIKTEKKGLIYRKKVLYIENLVGIFVDIYKNALFSPEIEYSQYHLVFF